MRFHPVLDHLMALPKWDGVARLDTWLIDCAEAEDTEYTRAVSRLPLLAAVRRVRQPGCKFDEMLTLQGLQGSGKSSALAILAGNPEWFSDQISFSARDKEVIEQLAGFWIIEVAELKGMRTAEIEHRKAFMSRQRDRGRLAYAMTVSDVPRQCIFIGTTNEERFLRDYTGHRRDWPVRVGRFDLGRLRRDRDQLWAEAVVREAKGRKHSAGSGTVGSGGGAAAQARGREPVPHRAGGGARRSRGEDLERERLGGVGGSAGQPTSAARRAARRGDEGAWLGAEA